LWIYVVKRYKRRGNAAYARAGIAGPGFRPRPQKALMRVCAGGHCRAGVPSPAVKSPDLRMLGRAWKPAPTV